MFDVTTESVGLPMSQSWLRTMCVGHLVTSRTITCLPDEMPDHGPDLLQLQSHEHWLLPLDLSMVKRRLLLSKVPLTPPSLQCRPSKNGSGVFPSFLRESSIFRINRTDTERPFAAAVELPCFRTVRTWMRQSRWTGFKFSMNRLRQWHHWKWYAHTHEASYRPP